jgi:hypothetical protein
VLSGIVGRIDWHYYTAAGIHGYKVAPPPKGKTEWTLAATVPLHDAFKMSQRPLTFIAKHAKGEWRFPVISFDLRDHKLTARLGPPEGLTEELKFRYQVKAQAQARDRKIILATK